MERVETKKSVKLGEADEQTWKVGLRLRKTPLSRLTFSKLTPQTLVSECLETRTLKGKEGAREFWEKYEIE